MPFWDCHRVGHFRVGIDLESGQPLRAKRSVTCPIGHSQWRIHGAGPATHESAIHVGNHQTRRPSSDHTRAVFGALPDADDRAIHVLPQSRRQYRGNACRHQACRDNHRRTRGNREIAGHSRPRVPRGVDGSARWASTETGRATGGRRGHQGNDSDGEIPAATGHAGDALPVARLVWHDTRNDQVVQHRGCNRHEEP